MRMKPRPFRGIVWAVCALGLGLIGSAKAATYQIRMHSVNHPGKYTFDPDDALESQLGDYALGATSSGSYWTFCLESSEQFRSDKIYYAEGAPGSSTTSTADPISAATAYLFEAFVTGNLSGFGFAPADGRRLQKMIWFLEEESGGYTDPASQDAALWGIVTAEFGDLAGARSHYAGADVGVLQLTKFDGAGRDNLAGTARQDQLVLWKPQFSPPPPPPSGEGNPVPDGGTSLLLLSLALGGLGWIRRFHD